MDTPFVSEEFQRAFRIQFPSQVSTGRDLHVSDVVVPVVDFTPTAAGTSLPLDLRWSYNTASESLALSSDTSNYSLISNSGFWAIELYGASDGYINALLNIDLLGSGSLKQIKAYYSQGANSFHDKFNVFLRSNDILKVTFSEEGTSAGNLSINYTQLADLYGNLIEPIGYSPQ